MKTIYECSQSKGIKWLTAIFFLVIIIAILVEVYFVSKGINLTVAMIVIALLLVVSISCVLIFPMYIISDDEGTLFACLELAACSDILVGSAPRVSAPSVRMSQMPRRSS